MSSDSDYLEIIYGNENTEDANRCSSVQNYLTDSCLAARTNALIAVYFALVFSFFILFAIPPLWPFAFLYLTWMYYDRKTPHQRGRKFPALRKLIVWRWVRNYFPIKLVKTAEIPADKNYLFAAFPHGVLSYGMATNVMTDANNFSVAYPGLDPYTVTLDQGFYFPITRDIALALGFCASSAESITNILNGPTGTVCTVVVGGARELQLSAPGTNQLFLRNRKGFVRLALKAGASLVPVYSFGETNTFYQPKNWIYRRIQEKLRITVNFPLFLLIGRGIFQKYFGGLPHRTPITTVIGKPIDLPKIADPVEEDVDKYHRMFVSELEKLFDKFKGKYDLKGEDAVLEIY